MEKLLVNLAAGEIFLSEFPNRTSIYRSLQDELHSRDHGNKYTKYTLDS